MRPNLLILGGTIEATALANALGEAGIDGTFSYAGRVERPRRQPLPTRTGGFGGADGLARWLRDNAITHVVDATHPFAAQMSGNAVAACAETGTPLIALTRPPWQPEDGDTWQNVPDIDAAADAVTANPRRVMLAIGRMHLESFARAPANFYLLRLVDPPDGPLPFDDYAIELSRGPFTVENDMALMRAHRIELIVSKNAGGTGARAKLDAARQLGLPVVMIDRPALPERREAHTVDAVLGWLAHAGTDLGV